MSQIVVEMRSDSPRSTQRIAAALAAVLVPGDVVALSGELGAGKTCFVQGAAQGLGIDELVTSPTFVLVRSYQGRLPLVHCDVYRLETLRDVQDLGEDVLADDVVTMIEWGDAVRAILPEERLEVELVHDEPPDDATSTARIVRLRAYGTSWSERADVLAELGAHPGAD